MSETAETRGAPICPICGVEMAVDAARAFCSCGWTFCENCARNWNVEQHDHGGQQYYRCPRCAAQLHFVKGESTIRVWGHDARDVERVAGELLSQSQRNPNQPTRKNAIASPWLSGLFYLFAIVVLVAVALAVANIVPVAMVPVTLVFALIGVSFVGALQLRQDNRLKETSFVKLMLESIKSLPLLKRR